MRASVVRRALLSLLAAACCNAAAAQSRPDARDEEVVRVNAELVQTDVTVLDKRGRFVEGLAPEQFELKVDGRAVPLSFLERVRAGGADEESKLAASRGAKTGEPRGKPPLRQPQDARGRVIFFFVDDVHLAADSLARARKGILRFADEQLASGDLVGVASTSGRVGFLQQLTDNRAVLRAAVARLTDAREREAYVGRVPVSEADANRIANHRDRELFAYLVEATKNEYQTGGKGGSPALGMAVTNMLRNRISQIDAQGRLAERATLAGLGRLLESSRPLAGRKLVFFISDGFVSDYRRSNGPDLLRAVTEEAARVGAVVYTLHARGTFGDARVDASRNDYPDFGVRTAGRAFIDAKMTQEPLERLAAETGGRAFLNNNSFDEAFAQAVSESSDYYLLAWRPESDAQRAGDSRVELSIKGRPDLRVQLRRRYFSPRTPNDANDKTRSTATVRHDAPPAQPPTTAAPLSASPSPAASSSALPASSSSALTAEAESALRSTLAALYPPRELPVALSVGYLDAQGKGTVLAASMRVDSDALDADAAGEAVDGDASVTSGDARLDVWGVAIDDRGSFASFRQVVAVSRETLAREGRRFTQWSQQLQLPPGLYQVRVAARDRRTGRTGGASQWVEIPEQRPGALALSSIFLAETRAGAGVAAVNVGRRFSRGSRLRFQTFIYNASAGAVALRVRVLRDGAEVLALPESAPKAAGAADPARLPFSGELSLEGLAPGRYVLEISAAAAQPKNNATQRADFILQ